MEIPIYFFVMIIIAVFSLGYTIGHQIGVKSSPAPDVITKSETMCSIFAEKTKKWRADLKIERIFKNGECVSVSCPEFDQKTKLCNFTQEKCVFIG